MLSQSYVCLTITEKPVSSASGLELILSQWKSHSTAQVLNIKVATMARTSSFAGMVPLVCCRGFKKRRKWAASGLDKLGGLNRCLNPQIPRSEEHTSELQSRRDL